jgi:hypothetical protein
MSKVKAKGAAAVRKVSKPKRRSESIAPTLPPSVEQYFVPGTGEGVVYHPRLIAAAEIAYNSVRNNIEDERACVYTVEFEDGPVNVDWDNSDAVEINIDDLEDRGEENATYVECPACASVAKNYTAWNRDFKRWLRQNETISLYRSKRFKLSSESGEAEGDFRARLQTVANEKRDQAVAKIRKRYASKVTTLENRLLRAQQSIDREKQQATKKKLDTAISFGTAILGAVLGRKRVSTSSATRHREAEPGAERRGRDAGSLFRRSGRRVG